jgi:hypothetical protein
MLVLNGPSLQSDCSQNDTTRFKVLSPLKMSDNTLIMVTVGSAYGPPTTFHISSRVRDSCPFFHVLQSGSMLPTTQIYPFHIVLSYLNGDDAFEEITSHNADTRLLLLFAKVWALAARLCLPALQNNLVSDLGAMFITLASDNPSNFGWKYPADRYVLQAIQHLREEVGDDSHAEMFLICLIGRTAPLICELERQMKRGGFGCDIKKKILAEARSFERDPIKHELHIFRISTSNPPQYPPLQVHHVVLPNVRCRASPTLELDELQKRGRIAQDRRRIGPCQASAVRASGSCRASETTGPFATASEAPSHSRRSQSMENNCHRWSEADRIDPIREDSPDHAAIRGMTPPRDGPIPVRKSRVKFSSTVLRSFQGSDVASEANGSIIAAPVMTVGRTPREILAQVGMRGGGNCKFASKSNVTS